MTRRSGAAAMISASIRFRRRTQSTFAQAADCTRFARSRSAILSSPMSRRMAAARAENRSDSATSMRGLGKAVILQQLPGEEQIKRGVDVAGGQLLKYHGLEIGRAHV